MPSVQWGKQNICSLSRISSNLLVDIQLCLLLTACEASACDMFHSFPPPSPPASMSYPLIPPWAEHSIWTSTGQVPHPKALWCTQRVPDRLSLSQTTVRALKQDLTAVSILQPCLDCFSVSEQFCSSSSSPPKLTYPVKHSIWFQSWRIAKLKDN